jgi:hypothetical protein
MEPNCPTAYKKLRIPVTPRATTGSEQRGREMNEQRKDRRGL